MNDNKKSAVIEFRRGMFGLILPFIVLFAGIIMLSVAGKAMPMAFWVPTLAAVLVALIMAKKPTQCADLLVGGMSNEMVAIMLMAWFLAGIVAQLMKESGLIQGLIWRKPSVHRHRNRPGHRYRPGPDPLPGWRGPGCQSPGDGRRHCQRRLLRG